MDALNLLWKIFLWEIWFCQSCNLSFKFVDGSCCTGHLLSKHQGSLGSIATEVRLLFVICLYLYNVTSNIYLLQWVLVVYSCKDSGINIEVNHKKLPV